ncbi:hypothetical protein ACX1C1_07710 [Paenibacillus sp. strain BS8-2]
MLRNIRENWLQSSIYQLKSDVSPRGLPMFHYDVTCYNCKKTFRVYEGSLKYKQAKERKVKYFCCEECAAKIRMEAIMNFMRGTNRF